MLWYSQPRPLIGVGYVKSSRSLVGVAEIRLTGFDAGRRMVSGTVEVRFVPGRAGEQPQSPEQYAELFRALEGYDAAYLTLEDEREGGAGDGRQKAIFRSGESDDLKFDRSQGVRARGSFHTYDRSTQRVGTDRLSIRPLHGANSSAIVAQEVRRPCCL